MLCHERREGGVVGWRGWEGGAGHVLGKAVSCALNRGSGGGQNKQILSELTIKVCLHVFGLPLASPQCCGLPLRTEGVRGGVEFVWLARCGSAGWGQGRFGLL